MEAKNNTNNQREIVREKLMKQFQYKNQLEVPRIVKIVLNMGVNDAVGNRGIIDKVIGQLSTIAGQKPLITTARKSISAFKLRKGMPMGFKATLRGKRMLDFWEKLVKIVLPRQRDFKGISTRGFDKQGNLNVGFREQTIFPDLDYDKIDKVRGIEVTIVTSTDNSGQAQALLETMGMPFKKEEHPRHVQKN